MQRPCNEAGFTLVELMVSLAVLAILVIPFLRKREDQPGEDDMLAEP